jgi:outer membrane protein OmpA-like peptidoglycan-associated protein
MIGSTVVAEVFGRYADVGDPEQRQTLTEFQAQEIANVLIALGVPVPQLRVKGFGSAFSEFVPDRDAAGHLDPAAAALNRTVIIEFTENVRCV